MEGSIIATAASRETAFEFSSRNGDSESGRLEDCLRESVCVCDCVCVRISKCVIKTLSFMRANSSFAVENRHTFCPCIDLN